MQFEANAKINLGLFIKAKRPDAYHEIESLFLPVDWSDEIEFQESDELKFSVEGIDIPHDPKGNLILRAYELLRARYDLPPLNIRLKKEIPIGAGLGGGSSDAAHMLKALNDHYQLQLSEKELRSMATELGSDCAFFIGNRAAIASGRGEMLKIVDIPQLPSYLLVVVPPLHISTVRAYSLVKPNANRPSIASLLELPMDQWQGKLSNDFEAFLCDEFPMLADLSEKLRNSDPVFYSMSGSGSAFYAFYHEKPELNFPDDYRYKLIKS